MAETTNYEVTEVHIEGLMGPKGDKGDPFTYEDFTESQLAPFEELKKAAETAATNAKDSELVAKNAATSAEALAPDVNTVASNMEYVSAVSVMSSDIAKVGKNITSVVNVEGGLDNIATAVTNLQDIKTVATNIDNVNTVSGIPDEISTVAGISEQVKVVGNNKTAVEALYKTLNMSVEATTLPAGSSATVKQTTTDTGFKVTFGIPKGDQGDINPNSLLFTAQSLTNAQKTQVATNLAGNWLPLTGGEVTGALTLDQGVNLKGALTFDSSNTAQLVGLPSGMLSWGGNLVLTQTDKTAPTSDSNTWKYRMNNGMLVQGGYISADSLSNAITFSTAYSQVPVVHLSYIDETGEAPAWLKALSTSGFTPGTSSTTATGLVWYAIGWI